MAADVTKKEPIPLDTWSKQPSALFVSVQPDQCVSLQAMYLCQSLKRASLDCNTALSPDTEGSHYFSVTQRNSWGQGTLGNPHTRTKHPCTSRQVTGRANVASNQLWEVAETQNFCSVASLLLWIFPSAQIWTKSWSFCSLKLSKRVSSAESKCFVSTASMHFILSLLFWAVFSQNEVLGPYWSVLMIFLPPIKNLSRSERSLWNGLSCLDLAFFSGKLLQQSIFERSLKLLHQTVNGAQSNRPWEARLAAAQVLFAIIQCWILKVTSWRVCQAAGGLGIYLG